MSTVSIGSAVTRSNSVGSTEGKGKRKRVTFLEVVAVRETFGPGDYGMCSCLAFAHLQN